MNALKEISKVWIVARMVYTLFESIIGNKQLEDRLHKSTGRRHHKKNAAAAAAAAAQADQKLTDPVKRKFDEMDISAMQNGPVQNVSYERSRPQTPAPTPTTMPMSAPSITPHRNLSGADTVMGRYTVLTDFS